MVEKIDYQGRPLWLMTDDEPLTQALLEEWFAADHRAYDEAERAAADSPLDGEP